MSRILLVSFLLTWPLTGIALLGVLAKPLLAASEGVTEVFPIQKTAPIAVAIESSGNEAELRHQMRVKNDVSELSTDTIRFSEAPVGSFGFIGAQALGMALVRQSPDLALERVAPTSIAYEIHKLVGGNGLLVGFMDRETAARISHTERPKNLRVALYSNPVQRAPIIVAVPLTKVMVDRMPTRLDPKHADSPVMMDMDLLTTINRTSPIRR